MVQDCANQPSAGFQWKGVCWRLVLLHGVMIGFTFVQFYGGTGTARHARHVLTRHVLGRHGADAFLFSNSQEVKFDVTTIALRASRAGCVLAHAK